MRRDRRPNVGPVAALFAGLFLGAAMFAQAAELPRLDTLRRLGKAYYENGDYKSAATQFRRCVARAPDSAADRFNLALVLVRSMQYDDVPQLLAEAHKLEPDLLNVHYLRGIVHKRQGRYEEAVKSLRRVVATDPQCWGAYYNLGYCYKNLRQFEKARLAFQAAAEIDPGHPSACYQLITLARRAGDVEQARRYAEIYERIKGTVDESEKTAEALERSEYTRILVSRLPAEQPSTRAASGTRLVDVTAAVGLESPVAESVPALDLPMRINGEDYREDTIRRRYAPQVGGALALGDYDGDGDLDIYVVNCSADPAASCNRLFRNQGGATFIDVTAESGVGDRGMGMDAVFGDYDNDGHIDLYVVNCGPNVLYHNQGDGRFVDVSQRTGANEPQFGRAAAFVDYDHDNDLDILLANDVELAEPPEPRRLLPDDFPGQVNALLRNNGDGTFLDQIDEAQLLVDIAQSRAVVCADFDGDYDTDLFISNANAPSRFFANARLGKFNAASTFSPPIDHGAGAAAEGDFDRDGDADLVVAVGESLYLYANGGQADFRGTQVPLPRALGRAGVGRIEILDYNNDGWLDLLLVASRGRALRLLACVGPKRFRDVSAAAGLAEGWGRIADVAAGDLDGDGDEDILLHTRDRGPRLLRSEASSATHWINVHLVGKKVNRNGYGATVEIAGPGIHQKQTARKPWLHFGLADRENVDIVRVTWPNGVAQNVIQPPIDGTLELVEHVRVSASCAMLWAYDGSRFTLVNEILGVGPLGVPMSPDDYHQPDCTELTRIPSRQLAAKDGKYELRVTGELREVVYVDAITLRVVDHPRGLEIIPNEMFTAPPFPEDKFFAVREHRAPRSAVDDRGVAVRSLVLEHDHRFPTFPTTEYDGLAQPHEITLDLGDLSGADHIMLYLDGWIYWPESSAVIAIGQDPRFNIAPLSLEVRDRHGRWRTVIPRVGLPTSKGAVVPVDLTGRFPCHDYHVRLRTNLCVYFDRIFVSTQDESMGCRVTELPVAAAELRCRGFSRMTRDRFGFETFNYGDVHRFGCWNPPPGRLTRFGPVRPLLSRADNMFVIFGPGDELALRFDGQNLPDLPTGWTRDFILYANGWVKDGDLNTAWSQHVEPLPFHGMSGYPYSLSERYPGTRELRTYRRTYNTRESVPTVRPLDAW